MKIVQAIKTAGGPFKLKGSGHLLKNPLVFVFANRFILEDEAIYDEVKNLFPSGQIVFGSTSGEIIGDTLLDESAVLTAIEFERSSFLIKSANVLEFNNDDSSLGDYLMEQFPRENLKHVFIISEGSTVNGSALIDGIDKNKGVHIGLSGGLCGDDDRFERTLVSYNEVPKEGEIIAIGFYGDTLEITSASHGGWTPFGPERIITRSDGNVLYELDGKPALDLYKKYLGDKASELPKSALFYPFYVKKSESKNSLVRTVLKIDQAKNTMTLAGDMPLGARVQLMMSSVDDIAQGAHIAAKTSMKGRSKNAELALLVSCIGRKLVMDQRTEEELEEVKAVIGNDTFMAGFYSYGEMAPFSNQKESCKLHNQTMTLTLFSE